MTRVKRGITVHRRHKKIFQLTKGFRGKRKNVFKLAKNAAMKAGMNAYINRRLKKRTFHQLWILRINNACRNNDIKYSRFIYGLELAGIAVNRKMLAEIAVNNPDAFKEVVMQAKAVLPPDGQAANLEELKKRFGKAEKQKMPENPSAEKVMTGGKKAEITPKKKAEKK